MIYVIGGVELILGFIFMVLSIDIFGQGSNSQSTFWRAIVVIPCLSFFLSGGFLLGSGSYWSQLFILPAILIGLFFILG